MQIFLDSASLADVERFERLGLIDGVTTNPALLAKEEGDPVAQLRAIAQRVPGPVSAQVTQGDVKEMTAQGRALAAIAPNVVVKIPAVRGGLEAARALASERIAVNVTLAFDPAQAVAFARVPVAYLSLIYARTEDFGAREIERIAAARRILDRMGSPTKLLVASIRNPKHLCDAIEGGADAVTVPPSTWDLVFEHPFTVRGLDDFGRSWNALPEPRRRAYDTLAEEA